MIRTVALLGLVGFASASWSITDLFGHKLWEEGLSYGFGNFTEIPRNSTAGNEQGWSLVPTRPTSSNSSGYDKLDLWVNPNNFPVGMLVDENKQISGLQVAIPVTGLTEYYDMVDQGATRWNYTNSDGDIEEYWTFRMYFVAEDEETRIASYNESRVLRENYVTVEGPKGELTKIPTNLTNLETIWTKQACVPLMGRHYYYNMTTTLSCDEPLFPWFQLWDEKTNQLIGIGFMMFGKPNSTNFEFPPLAVIKIILENAPECLFTLAEKYGVYTIHFYFNDNPKLIFC